MGILSLKPFAQLSKVLCNSELKRIIFKICRPVCCFSCFRGHCHCLCTLHFPYGSSFAWAYTIIVRIIFCWLCSVEQRMRRNLSVFFWKVEQVLKLLFCCDLWQLPLKGASCWNEYNLPLYNTDYLKTCHVHHLANHLLKREKHSEFTVCSLIHVSVATVRSYVQLTSQRKYLEVSFLCQTEDRDYYLFV